jgi:hypothetical protein
VHITNCCANSADQRAFAGEIVIADFADPAPFPGLHGDTAPPPPPERAAAAKDNDEDGVRGAAGGSGGTDGLSLARAFLDVQLLLSALVAAAAPCLAAQRSSRHFEYLGVDAMVSG